MESTWGFLQPSFFYPLPRIGIILIILAATAHYFKYGPKDMHSKDKTDQIPWWSLLERLGHGILVISFLYLLFSGIILSTEPYRTEQGFLGLIWKIHHMGIPFTLGLVLVIVLWFKHALPKAYDREWLRHLGGYLGYKGSLKAGRFNAGQKFWFWVMLVGGITLIVTGINMESLEQGTELRNILVIVHLIAASTMLMMFALHLYLSVFAVKGILRSMWDGKKSKVAALKYHSETPFFQEKKHKPGKGSR